MAHVRRWRGVLRRPVHVDARHRSAPTARSGVGNSQHDLPITATLPPLGRPGPDHAHQPDLARKHPHIPSECNPKVSTSVRQVDHR
jgi:hypothetical protein